MRDIKEIVALNISELRKANGYTQITFAEKINYSNKTVSKWERGESTPDIETLKQLADLFGVTIQYFIEEHDQDDKVLKARSQKPKLQICINLMICCVIWVLATLIFVYNACFTKEIKFFWQIFIWAIPTSCLVLSYFNWKWFHQTLYGFILASIFTWTLLTGIYVQWYKYNLWLIFIVGIPFQAAVTLFYWMKYLSTKQ